MEKVGVREVVLFTVYSDESKFVGSDEFGAVGC
jgi:hypothetical protein